MKNRNKALAACAGFVTAIYLVSLVHPKGAYYLSMASMFYYLYLINQKLEK